MSKKEAICLQPIGTVFSPILEPIDHGWGKVVSKVVLRAELQPGLLGLAEYSHVIVVYWMHRATFQPLSDLTRHPRGNIELPLSGIFAQRAKHRPNPIGITAAKLLDISKNTVIVQGLDAIDGTPVLDLKPYVATFDRIENPTEPDWLKQMLSDYFTG